MRIFLTALCVLLASPLWAAHPEFFNRTADNTKLAQMKTDYEADADCTTSPTTVSSAACQPATYGGRLYKLIHDNSASDNRYSDIGQWGAIMYKATGTAAYATQAFGEVTADLLSLPDTAAALCGNFSREDFITHVLDYDWLYNGLTGTERTDFLNKLKTMANLCTTADKFRPEDGDQPVGDYFGIALLKLAEPADSTIDTYWTTENTTRKLGFFTSTASDGSNRRNTIRHYVDTLGAGGEWPESSEYNPGSMKLLLLGAEAVRSARGGDDYPDITAWADDACEQVMQDFTPGINNSTSQRRQWADDENPRILQSFYTWETAAVLAGACAGMSVGPRIQDFVLDWLDSTTVSGIDPWPRFHYLFDPYATRGDHTTSAKTRFASGEGLLSSRTGWAGSSKVLWAHLHSWQSFDKPNGGSQMDHSPYYWGEFQLWADGEWEITHPIAYASPTNDSRATNSLSLGGIPAVYYAPAEYRGVPVYDQSDANGYTYFAGTMGGSIVRSAYWNMPATFVMEHTRSFVWLPDRNTLVVHDRANSKDPQVLGTTGYPGDLKTWMDAFPAPKALWVHSQLQPTLQTGYIQYPLASGDTVRVTHLLPTSVTRTVEDETVVFSGAYYGLGYWTQSEKDWHVRVSPSSEQQWDTFLNVWNPYTSTPATVVLVQDTTNKVDCSLITDTTLNRLVCFNALQGQDIPDRTLVSGVGYYTAGVSTILDVVRKRTSSFTLTFTVAGGSTTKAILADLDTSKTWTYQINGGSSVGLTPSSAGIGIVDLTETGSVTLAVATTGIADLVITTTSPLPSGSQNVAYSSCVSATGGVLPYTWTKTAGTYPTGLSLTASTGCVAGTPSGTGLSNFTLQVADSQGTPDTASRAFDLTINAAATPTLIETTSLPEAAIGVAYSQGIVVSGGTPPYTCSLFSGAVPTGMSVNSTCGTVLTGTPTVPDQNTSFTLRACDSAGTPVCDDQAFTLHVSFLISFVTQLELQHLGATAVTGRIGAIGLPYETDCSVTITGVSPASTTEGSGRRTFVIAGLTADTQYDVVGECVYAAFASQSSLITFRTLPAPSGGDRTVPITLKASSVLSTAARVTVDYDDNPALSTPVSVQNPSCASGCTVNLTIPAGLYYYRWRWQTSGDVVLATSAIQPLMVQ